MADNPYSSLKVDLSGQTAVVTGASQGLGKAIGQVCDVSNPAQVAAAVAATDKAFGGVQVLVNNAPSKRANGAVNPA